MEKRPYATPEGLRTYLASLAGLHALREERRAAAGRGESLPAFCVLGTYVLSADGRFGQLSGIAAGPFRDLPDVVSLDELESRGRRAYGQRWSLSYTFPAPLAPRDSLCPGCGQGWTHQERADVAEWIERRTCLLEDEVSSAEILVVLPMHARCHAAATARDDLWWAEDTLDLAGFEDAVPVPCAPPASGGIVPWFRVATWRGEIRFGQKSPGFGIDWSGTGRELPQAFCRIERGSVFGPLWNEPPVDHGPFHVQPKHEGYLIEYLRRLREILDL